MLYMHSLKLLLVADQIFNHLELIATLISINIIYFLSITPWFPSYLNVKRDQLWIARGRRENRFNFTSKVTSRRPVYEMIKQECHYTKYGLDLKTKQPRQVPIPKLNVILQIWRRKIIFLNGYWRKVFRTISDMTKRPMLPCLAWCASDK